MSSFFKVSDFVWITHRHPTDIRMYWNALFEDAKSIINNIAPCVKTNISFNLDTYLILQFQISITYKITITQSTISLFFTVVHVSNSINIWTNYLKTMYFVHIIRLNNTDVSLETERVPLLLLYLMNQYCHYFDHLVFSLLLFFQKSSLSPPPSSLPHPPSSVAAANPRTRHLIPGP